MRMLSILGLDGFIAAIAKRLAELLRTANTILQAALSSAIAPNLRFA
jgi:hypothetical protein